MGKRDRMKASDVFRETNFIFSGKTSFEEAFPEIKSVTVKCTEKGYGIHREWATRTYTKKNLLGEYIDCSNDICYNGGFSIGRILREMVSKKETHYESLEFCQGYEGSPKGRMRYRSCTNSWEVIVDIVYYSEDEIEEKRK